MKILHCIPTMSGGGAERQLSLLCGGLVAEGCEVHVALLQGGTNLTNLKKSGAVIHLLSGLSNYDPGIFLQFIELLRKVRPEVVQTWLLQMDVVGGIAASLLGIPFIISERSSAAAYSASLKSRLREGVGKKAALIIANSDGGAEYWSTTGIESTAISVIRNITPVEEIQCLDRVCLEQEGILPDAEIILFAGRFNEWKNIRNLLTALREVLAQRHRAVALLFGEGPLKKEMLKMLQSDQSLARVQIRGFADNILNWMRTASVFVSVSYFEGQPNSVFEAIAAGCPVILSDISAHQELLDDNCAWFVSPSSPGEIAAGVSKCLDSPQEAAMKAQRALEKVLPFSVKAVARQYQSHYLRILHQRIKLPDTLRKSGPKEPEENRVKARKI